MAPPDGELANSTAQNHVSKSNRDGKTKKNQTDPNLKRQLLLGLNNPPYRGRTTNLAAPVSGTECHLPLTIYTPYSAHSKETPLQKKYNRFIPRPIKKTQPMPHLLPSIISRPTIQIRNTQQYPINISHSTGQQTNLKMIQNHKTDNSNNKKLAAVSNNTSPSKQAGSEGEIMTPYTSNTRFNIGREKS